MVRLLLQWIQTSCGSQNHGTVGGVDLGVTTLATLSTGEKITGPKAQGFSTECADCPARYLERRKILPIATRRSKTGKTSRTDSKHSHERSPKLTTGLVLDPTRS